MREILELPGISEFMPDAEASGFSQDFTELFARTDESLLRSSLRKGAIVAFRQRDLMQLAAHPSLGNMPLECHSSFQRLFRNQVFVTNPPVRAPMRQTVAHPFAPKQIRQAEQLARKIIAALLEEVLGGGEIEFREQVSETFTVRFWATLFNMEEDEQKQLHQAMRTFAPVFRLGRTAEETAAVGVALDRYMDVVADAVERSLHRGSSDLLASMAEAFRAVPSESRPARFGEMVAANVLDGVHTVAVAGTNVLFQWFASDQIAALRADPTLHSGALAEGLRLWSPLIYTERYALADMEYAGIAIPAGTIILMLWAAGNRDPAIFSEPGEFRLQRQRRTETTFGGGIHICPGRYLERLLLRVMLEAVVAPDIQIDLVGHQPMWVARSAARELDQMTGLLRRCESHRLPA
jgi:cytochrome P450